MKSISFIAGAFSVVALAAGGAFAQSAEYSAESIIQHFEQSGADDGDCAASGDCIAKSGTRGLSIGSTPAPAPAPAPAATTTTAAPATAGTSALPPVDNTTSTEPSTTGGDLASAEPRMGEIAPSQPVAQPAAAPPAGFNLLITFELGSANLTPQAQANLDEFASAVADPRLSNAVFAINGHTDASGGDDYNLALSEQRAASVVSYLTGKGVDSSRLIPRGFGEEQPRTADPYDGANRRVEATLISQ